MNLITRFWDNFSDPFFWWHMLINFLCQAACVEFLTIQRKYLSGPRPNVLVIDGIAVGLQNSVLDTYKSNVAEELTDKSWQNVCQVSNFFKTTIILVNFYFHQTSPEVRSFWGWSLLKILKLKILWLEFDNKVTRYWLLLKFMARTLLCNISLVSGWHSEKH